MYFRIIILLVTLSLAISNNEITDDRLERIQSLLSDKKELAPDIALNSSSDSLYVLSDLKGKVVLINFWATWCGPCRMEIPDFNDLYKKYNKDGFEILGISLSDTKKQLIDFAKVYNVEYPLLYGNFKEIDSITRSYGGVPAVPWSFLVGVEGDIIKTYPGAIIAQYDPVTHQNLVHTIESQLNIKKEPQDLE